MSEIVIDHCYFTSKYYRQIIIDAAIIIILITSKQSIECHSV